MNTQKYLICLLIGLFSPLLIQAQSFEDQEFGTKEFGVYIGAGASSLKYKTSVGEKGTRMNVAFGMNASFYLSNNWSVGSGFELSNMNSRFSMKNVQDTYQSNLDGEAVEFRTNIKNYREVYNLTYLSLPLYIQYETEVSESASFYISGGGMIGMAAQKKFEVNRAKFESEAFFPNRTENQLVNMGGLEQYKKKRSAPLRYACMLTAETGVKWSLGDQMFIYTGVYLNYGLNDIRKSAGGRVLDYKSLTPSQAQSSSILTSSYGKDGESVSYVTSKKIVPINIGLRLKFAFSI